MQVQISEYEKQANDLLAKLGITFTAELIGKDCPRFCEDAIAERDMHALDTYPRKSHIHGKHYRCTFQRDGHSKGKEANGYTGSMSIDFWNSYADEEYNKLGTASYRHGETLLRYDRKGKRTVSAYDVLACITKSEPGTFEEFCSEFGYSSDSMRAHDTWKAVRAEWRKVQGFFYPDEITAIQEVQ
jgi:hypothetical protein